MPQEKVGNIVVIVEVSSSLLLYDGAVERAAL